MLPADATIWGCFDVDRNPATGLPLRGVGAQHVFLADVDGEVVFHVIGKGFIFDSGGQDASWLADGLRRVLSARDPPVRVPDPPTLSVS